MRKRGYSNFNKLILSKSKRSQIWVETVIYTLIAFALIGLVLTYLKPKIEEIKDKSIIEQTLSIMKDLDSIILAMTEPGNQRIIELRIRKGEMIIDGVNDYIIFEMESVYPYTEPGIPAIYEGNIAIRTIQKGSANFINLTRDFNNIYNLTYLGKDETKIIAKSSSPYKIKISNRGNSNIDFEIS